jgi:hypothetical protein
MEEGRTGMKAPCQESGKSRERRADCTGQRRAGLSVAKQTLNSQARALKTDKRLGRKRHANSGRNEKSIAGSLLGGARYRSTDLLGRWATTSTLPRGGRGVSNTKLDSQRSIGSGEEEREAW